MIIAHVVYTYSDCFSEETAHKQEASDPSNSILLDIYCAVLDWAFLGQSDR